MPTFKRSLLAIWNYYTSIHVEAFWYFLVKSLDFGVIGFLLLFHSALLITHFLSHRDFEVGEKGDPGGD